MLQFLFAGLIIEKNFFTLLLSYCPGGIYEVAVIVFFDLDPEFVAFHHIIRLLMILFFVPIMLKLLKKKTHLKLIKWVFNFLYFKLKNVLPTESLIAITSVSTSTFFSLSDEVSS